jgi:non-heme chloroperoxidase
MNSVQIKNGIRLSYREQGPQDGTPVLFLHGLTDSSFSFSRVLPLLGPSIRAIVPDQRGHGDSEKPQSGYTMDHLAADALALLDALLIPSAIVVGHSMGSFVAQQMAVSAPCRVASLVLVGSGSSHTDAIHSLLNATADLTDPVPEEFCREFQMSTIWRPLPADFITAVVDESRRVPARAWTGCLDGMLRHSPVLERISCPTVLLWGDRDSVFCRAEQEELRCRIPGAELRIASGVGHAYHWEAPGEFVTELGSLLPVAAI